MHINVAKIYSYIIKHIMKLYNSEKINKKNSICKLELI